MKKIISIVLLCTMLLSCFVGCGAKKGQIALNNDVEMQNLAATVDWSTVADWDGSVDTSWYGDGSAETFYLADGADLRGFLVKVRTDEVTFSGKKIELTANIDLGGEEWAPIVCDENDNGIFFAGTFDGKGFTIGNFTMTLDDNNSDPKLKEGQTAAATNVADVVGGHALLGSIGGGATIQNLSVVGATYVANYKTNSSSVLGGLVAEVNTGSKAINLTNVSIAGSITDTGDKAIGYVGGIAGKIKGSGTVNITNCTSNVTINVKGSRVGGIIGNVNNGVTHVNVTGCTVSASVTTASSDLGGVIGCLENDDKKTAAYSVTVTDCTVSGALKATGARIGGIIGDMSTKCRSVTIEDCVVSGSITGGSSHVAGLVGRLSSNFKYSGDGAVDRPVTATFRNCTVSGDIKGSGDNIAGVVGQDNGAQRTLLIENCDVKKAEGFVSISLTAGKSSKQNGGIIGITAAKMEGATVTIKNCDVVADINIPHANGQNGGIAGSINNEATTIQNCTYTGTMTSDRSSGGIIGIVNKSSSRTRVMINGCTVNGTLNYNLAGNNNLYMGGIIGLARVGSGAMYVLNCTVDATMNMTFNHNSAAATEYTGAGALIGGANDPDVDTSAGVFIIKNNTVLGQLNVTDNDVDGAVESYVDAIAEKAGVLVGSSANAAGNSFQYGNNQISNGTKTLTVTATGIEVDMVGTDVADYIDIIGYQTTEVVDGKYDLRVVAVARADIDALGFIANIKYTDAEGNVIGDRVVTEYVDKVYSSINGGGKTYTADEYRTDYFYTLVIKGIPEEYNEDRLGIQLHAIGAKVTPGEGDAYTIDKYLRGAVVTYGTFATKESENNVVISDSAEQALPTTLAAVIGKETADITVDMDSYTANYYTGVRILKEAYYPDTNTPHYNDASSMEANIYTYTIDIETAGKYDIVFELRCKDGSSRGVYMYINGEDGYFIKNATLVNEGSYAADNDENMSVNSRYAVAVSGYEFKAGENKLTFKLDRTLAGAMHVRGIYINATPAVED